MFEHLINSKEQVLILFGGLPASGKSTLAKEFLEAGFKVVCPDTNRGIIAAEKFGGTPEEHEGNQEVNPEAWKKSYQDASEFLKQGYSVVFDATFPTRKQRATALSNLKRLGLKIVALYLDVTPNTSMQRNLQRAAAGGRNVPDFVIKSKWRTQTLPVEDEGFDEVIIISEVPHSPYKLAEDKEALDELFTEPLATITKWHESGFLKTVFPSIERTWDVNQNNKNHNFLLHEHMLNAAEAFKGQDLKFVITMALHDVGKVDTKEFFGRMKAPWGKFEEGEKVLLVGYNVIGVICKKLHFMGEHSEIVPLSHVEADPNAHFYDHHFVGALMARRELLMNGFDEDFANDVYRYIVHHMDLPFREYNTKQLRKLVAKITPPYIDGLLKIRRADKSAGAWKPEIGPFLDQLTKDLHEVINEGNGSRVSV